MWGEFEEEEEEEERNLRVSTQFVWGENTGNFAVLGLINNNKPMKHSWTHEIYYN